MKIFYLLYFFFIPFISRVNAASCDLSCQENVQRLKKEHDKLYRAFEASGELGSSIQELENISLNEAIELFRTGHKVTPGDLDNTEEFMIITNYRTGDTHNESYYGPNFITQYNENNGKALSYVTQGNQVQQLFSYIYTQLIQSADGTIHGITFASEHSTVPFPSIVFSSDPTKTILNKKTPDIVKTNGDYIIVKFAGEKSKVFSFRIGKILTP